MTKVGNRMPARHLFSVHSIQLLPELIYRVELELPAEGIPDYFAGQYLLIYLENSETCAFSIASPPHPQQKKLELHIQKIPDHKNSSLLFKQLATGSIEASVGYGNCHLKEIPDKPLLFVAAGTGFAQMKSMIEYCQHQKHPHDLYFYWGAREPENYYLPNLPVQWSTRGVHYHPVVSEADFDGNWNGRHGLLYEAIIADKKHLKFCEMYISGSPNMVYTTVDAIVSEGFNPENIHSDVFEYAPRT